MSKALHCDRCGTDFLPFIMIEVTDLITTIPEIHFQSMDDYMKGFCYHRKRDINLCPKCTNEFLKFMGDFKYEADHLSCLYSNLHDGFLDEYDPGSGRLKHGEPLGNGDCETAEREIEPE